MPERTREGIDKEYTSALDSVNLINSENPNGVSDDNWLDMLNRNAEHLKIVVAKDYFTTEHDLTVLVDAIDKVIAPHV